MYEINDLDRQTDVPIHTRTKLISGGEKLSSLDFYVLPDAASIHFCLDCFSADYMYKLVVSLLDSVIQVSKELDQTKPI